MKRRRIFKIGIALLLIVLWRGCVAWRAVKETANSEQVSSIKGLKIEYLITPEHMVQLGDIVDFDVDSNQHILVSNDSGMLEIATSKGSRQIDRLSKIIPNSFALDGQGSLLAVTGQYFGQLEDTVFSQAVPLPYDNMRLMPSTLSGVAYLIGGKNESARRVYSYFADGLIQIQTELPDPVVAVADNRHAVYVASEHDIFRVTGNDMQVVMRVPEDKGKIVSIAVEPDDQTLYFATDSTTYMLSGLAAVALVRDLGGTLRIRNDKLYIWSPTRKIMISVSGMRDFIAKEKAAQ